MNSPVSQAQQSGRQRRNARAPDILAYLRGTRSTSRGPAYRARAIAQPVRAPDGGPTLCGASREARACARPTGETDRVRARGRLVPRHSPHDCRATAVARSRREAIRSNHARGVRLPRRNAWRSPKRVPSGARRFISSAESALEPFRRSGLNVLEISEDQFAERLRSESHTLKRALTDPRLRRYRQRVLG